MKSYFLLVLLIASPVFAKLYNTGENRSEIGRLDQSIPPVVNDSNYLLDNKDSRFWKEGNHVPDEAFVILGQDPTNIEKAKLWLLRNEKKAKVLQLMMKTIELAQRDLLKSGQVEDRYDELDEIKWDKHLSMKPVKDQVSVKESSIERSEDISVFFVFHPSCNYCHKQSLTLTSFKNVIPLQVSDGEIMNFQGLYPSQKIDSDVKKQWFGEGAIETPQLIIVNQKTNKATRLKGYSSTEQIVKAMAKVAR
ncbi:MAG: hypothetical protein COV57_03105 [Candidatus Liptonbacteria bacterium CG11_big_fil_rev_8_21_14_0_20_35_14]|uniref:Thioredoxin-like fold domain-containing protein n=1 Tax=Candidatus Liptonbacteria bacterium CG11_big_fil_rev_8_21_14_0_20_35_14 TaxID=1974634 RepID=A0A2H0N710_9BACT|nr:MAG: hypothetical protein COV57_03105 [Candidatus Liptonbacteria bacterium CG11_big_fil_rev_8_21_14_0_20_35_14]PJB52566.1 MAG: hypothetical protein CO099_11930 [Bdellovibrio sp. CG_4_9_14_3_um_filter_39_7]